MKKITFLTSFVALTFAVPAMAVPSNTSSTFPANGKMLEDYTYTNQATVTNLKVSSGTATTSASYTDCPSGYPNSDDGATSTDQCYKACTVSDFPANSHISTVTGKNYQGANIADTCAIATCDTGYTLNPGAPNLTEIIGNTIGTASGHINHSGTYVIGTGSTSQAEYGITEPDTFGVAYGNAGLITGTAVCSTQTGNREGDLSNNVPSAWGTGYECWCRLNTYNTQSISSAWMYSVSYAPDDMGHGGADECTNSCASRCQIIMAQPETSQRLVLFNSVPTNPSCDANEISITWADASAEDIAANDAGSVTYGGDIRTPKKAVHKPGKIFTGWTFNTPSGN